MKAIKMRRGDIFAESFEPDANFVPPIIQKSKAEKATLLDIFRHHFLFSSLQDSSIDSLINAAEKKTFQSGQTIITQGNFAFLLLSSKRVFSHTVDTFPASFQMILETISTLQSQVA